MPVSMSLNSHANLSTPDVKSRKSILKHNATKLDSQMQKPAKL